MFIVVVKGVNAECIVGLGVKVVRGVKVVKAKCIVGLGVVVKVVKVKCFVGLEVKVVRVIKSECIICSFLKHYVCYCAGGSALRRNLL